MLNIHGAAIEPRSQMPFEPMAQCRIDSQSIVDLEPLHNVRIDSISQISSKYNKDNLCPMVDVLSLDYKERFLSTT